MADEMKYFAEILFRGVCVLVLMQTTTLASTMFFFAIGTLNLVK